MFYVSCKNKHMLSNNKLIDRSLILWELKLFTIVMTSVKLYQIRLKPTGYLYCAALDDNKICIYIYMYISEIP